MKPYGIFWMGVGKPYTGTLLIYDMELFEESIDQLIFDQVLLDEIKQRVIMKRRDVAIEKYIGSE